MHYYCEATLRVPDGADEFVMTVLLFYILSKISLLLYYLKEKKEI